MRNQKYKERDNKRKEYRSFAKKEEIQEVGGKRGDEFE